jgi:signal peptidase I
VFALIALVVVTPIVLPLVTNTRWIVVAGASMTPAITLGDIAIVSPLGDTPPAEGEVITVAAPDGRLYTHRVVAIARDGLISTRGDANTYNDRDTVRVADVEGRVTGVLTGPPAAVVRDFAELPVRLTLAAVVLALFLLPVRPRREPVREPTTSTTAQLHV